MNQNLLDPAAVFRQQASEILEQLETVFLDLERKPDDRALIDAAFRAMHTLKGSGAMFGFDRVAAFMHGFETTFDLVRKGKIKASPAIVAVSLKARDFVRGLIEEAEPPSEEHSSPKQWGSRRSRASPRTSGGSQQVFAIRR
jgi:two-component system chemotaxis sensor kinase CheA